MKQSIRNQFDQIYYEADFDAEHNWVDVTWNGELTLSDIKIGVLAFAELLEISRATKLLNNTVEVAGEFADLRHWTNAESIKPLSELGLKCYAQVSGDRKNHQLDELTSSLLSQGLSYKAFKSAKKAKVWLSKFEG
jgi:hypothetical protein